MDFTNTLTNWGTAGKAGALLWKLQGPSRHLDPSLLPPDFSLTHLNPCCPHSQHATDNLPGHTPRISPLLTTTRCCATGSPFPGIGSHIALKPLSLEAAAREPLADGVPVLGSHSCRANSKTLNTGPQATQPVLWGTLPAPHLSCCSPLRHIPAYSSKCQACFHLRALNIQKACLFTEARPLSSSPPPPAHCFPQHTLIYRWSPLVRWGPVFPLMVPNTAPGI